MLIRKLPDADAQALFGGAGRLATRPVRSAKPGPSLDLERSFWERGSMRVIGADEVGVSPICGPLLAAAVEFSPALDAALLEGVRDSKLVRGAPRRGQLAAGVCAWAERYALGAASVVEVDRWGQEYARALALDRALARMGSYDIALVDGGPLPLRFSERARFVPKGDMTSLSIASASLVARAALDRIMDELARRYPGYGWETNAGYPVPKHLAALEKMGLTRHHRRNAREVRRMIAGGTIRAL